MAGRASLSFQPRMMATPQAAAYLGISSTTLDKLGIPRRKLGAKRLYDRIDLDAYADDLPIDGESDSKDDEVAQCDELFGGAG